MSGPLRELDAFRLEGDDATPMRDCVAEEMPVALVYNGVSHAVMMATPVDLHDFAVGFSLSEGIVVEADEIDLVEIRSMPEGVSIQMAIPSARFEALAERGRNLTGRAGCGLCGSDSLATAIRPVPAVARRQTVDAVAIRKALRMLQSRQPLNARCHGLHAAGFSVGDSIFVREDVGRHNALDKVIGALARETTDPGPGFLVITSRASYEVVHKAATAGIGLVAAISAPTALAIDLARDVGLALVAFARESTMTVYSQPV